MSSHYWVGQKKEERKKKRRGSGMEPAPLEGRGGRGDTLASGEATSPMGKSVGTEGEHQRLLEVGETAAVADRTE